MTLTPAALDLILSAEGIDQPWEWPGGGSGITLGYGCDIGADPASLAYWEPHLSKPAIELLAQAKGKTGRAAAQIATRFRAIQIHRQAARAVFFQSTLPREIALTLAAFPGIEHMPAPVQGALVSLVYNRGTDLKGPRRHEMRIIHEILADFQTLAAPQRAQVQDEYIRKIALQIRKMKRLWLHQGIDGLLLRRDAEADLALSAIGNPVQ